MLFSFIVIFSFSGVELGRLNLSGRFMEPPFPFYSFLRRLWIFTHSTMDCILKHGLGHLVLWRLVDVELQLWLGLGV